jgi:hypothetical protein
MSVLLPPAARMSALRGLVHAEDRIGIVFVANLVNLLAASFAHV